MKKIYLMIILLFFGFNSVFATDDIIINNIDEDPGINKEIFDEDTLIEIWELDAVIKLSIVFIVFFNRVTYPYKRKRKKIIF